MGTGSMAWMMRVQSRVPSGLQCCSSRNISANFLSATSGDPSVTHVTCGIGICATTSQRALEADVLHMYQAAQE